MNIWLLIGCIALCEAVGIVSGFATVKSVKTWYKKLKKPSFNPPPFIFGPVWTVLYAMMGIALYLVLTTPSHNQNAVLFFFIQLILNGLWTIIFFTFKKLFLSFVVILTLLATIIITTILFWPINQTAALLMIPYIAWVSFASLLNGAIWKKNS